MGHAIAFCRPDSVCDACVFLGRGQVHQTQPALFTIAAVDNANLASSSLLLWKTALNRPMADPVSASLVCLVTEKQYRRGQRQTLSCLDADGGCSRELQLQLLYCIPLARPSASLSLSVCLWRHSPTELEGISF
jgi:hypothetical protein